MTEAPQLLGGRYALGPVLGRGGMAEVHRATDVRLGREVAVKVLRPDLARDPTFQSRFRREAQAAASIDAPAVVAVYDTGEDDTGVPWIVMELVEGRTLRAVLETEGPLQPRRALEVTADVCAALAAAHATGMVHRDIKPANVMLDDTGAVKVMDFGIARAAAASTTTATQTAAVVGTAAYLSPEQARGEHVDARSDLYSTGCLLYELVTGVPPFVGDSAVAVAYQHVREEPLPPSRHDPTMPARTAAALDAVVLKAMAKNPANRYPDAPEMRADLLRAAAGEPVRATPLLERALDTAPPAAVDVGPRRGRWRAAAYAAFALVLLAVGLLTGVLVHTLRGTPTGLLKPPAVVGMPQSAATGELAAAGLRVGRATGRFDAAAAGTVLSQSPDEHFFVERGGSVDLVVSRGPQRTAVPAVVGLAVEDATRAMTAQLLTTTRVTEDGSAPAGTVVRTEPAAGAVVTASTAVKLVVSSGLVRVPEVRGRSLDDAIAALTGAGFSVAYREVDSTVTPGTVLSQDPAEQSVEVGRTVRLDVARAPAAPGGPAPSP